MMNMFERIEWVDIYKALLIIMMVFGHAGSPFTTYIYLFHMPAFIFIAGYTFRGNMYTLKTYVVKKIITLVIPAFLINVIYAIILDFLQRTNVYSLITTSPAMPLTTRLELIFKYFGFPEWGGATWFLIVLFLVELFYILIYKSVNGNAKWAAIIGLVISALGWYFIKQYPNTPMILTSYFIDLGLFGVFFYVSGILTRRYCIFEQYISQHEMTIFSVITAITFGSFYFRGKIPMNWPTRVFDDLFVHIITCFCMFYLCYKLSLMISSTKLSVFFVWIGRHTLSILLLHFVGFKVAYVLLYMLGIYGVDIMGYLTPPWSPYPLWLYSAGVSVTFCLAIAKISEKYCISNYIVNGRVKGRLYGTKK